MVIFQDNGYGLNPALPLWVDSETFDGHVLEGHRLERIGQVKAAITQYEAAVSLYQGDFLAEDLYENWPALTRECLRAAYVDTLDRLSCLYFNLDQWAECARLCRKILLIDNCREDVHCRLMRCLSREDRHPLALRQYQACVEALHAELDVRPAPATVQLAERIRRREGV
jgi:DNA-binding SARP family transcriptional activator